VRAIGIAVALCGAAWAQSGAEWPMYHGSYASWHHSTLTEITPANAKNLELQWVWQAQSLEKFETTPIVSNGILYLTEAPNTIVALDAITGQTPTPIPADQEAAIVGWLAAIGETDQAIIADVLTTCRHDEGARAYCLGRVAHVATDDLDDRRSCRQCRNLRAGVCIVAKPGSAVSATRGYRPAAPEMLRRCDGYAT